MSYAYLFPDDSENVSMGTESLFTFDDLEKYDIVSTMGEETTRKNLLAIQSARLCAAKNDSKAGKLFLSTTDNKNYRLYLSPRNYLDSSQYHNKFNMFLDSLNEENTVEIILGSAISFWFMTLSLGSLICGMRHAKCNIITRAVGRCSPVESILWCFGKERTISPYADLNFVGVFQILKQQPAYKEYFHFIFQKAAEANVITEEQIHQLLTSNCSLYYSGAEKG